MHKNIRNLIVVVFSFCFSYVASAQERTISGAVTDSNGLPVLGATVLVKGTSNGTATDFDGNFNIQASTGDVLSITAVGLKKEEITITEASNYDVTMAVNVAELGAVVITGFDNVEERLFTGASSSITAEELKVDGVVDVSRMLEGKAAGVSVKNISGTFGAAPQITIRGASSIYGDVKPLWVIDGVVQEDIVNLSLGDLTSGDAQTLIGSSIAGLNANDIKGIEILKDAAATSLYGARAMNGVVVITTKSGKRETPLSISYTSEYTIRDIPRYDNYDILDSRENMSILREMEAKGYLTQAGVVQSRYGGVYYGMYDKINTYNEATDSFLLENTQEARDRYLQTYELANTNWFKTLFRQSLTQSHSVSFNGGGKSNAYYASVSYYGDAGWSIADKVSRITTNLKNTFFVSDDFNVTLIGKGSIRNQRAPGTFGQQEDAFTGEVSREFDINPFSYALNTSRTLRPYDEEGNYEYAWNNWAPINIIEELENNYMDLGVIDFSAQAQTDWDITDHISHNANFSARYVNTTNEHNVRRNTNVVKAYNSDETTIIRDANIFLYSDPENPTAAPVVALPYGGIYNRRDNSLESYYLRNNFSYQNKFNRLHDLNVLIGQDLRYVNRRTVNFTGYGLQYDRGYQPFPVPEIFAKTIGQGDEYFGINEFRERTVAFFGKATYGFDNRYVFTATGRYDGSNQQGRSGNSRWLPTWSVSGKWNVSNEEFMDNSGIISNLSFRPSYGLTATTGPASNTLVIILNEIASRFSVSDRENYLDISELANYNLTWEKQYEANLGLDLGLFDNRIALTTNVYRRDGFDLMDFVFTSGVGGKSVEIGNNADMVTEGVEFALSTTNIKTENFKWNTVLNFSTYRQEITKLESTPRVLDLVGPIGGNVEGYPRNSLFSFDFDGLDSRGLPTFNLPDGVDPVTGVDFQSTENILDYLVYEGPTAPTTSAGLSNTFEYKNWSLNFFISASWGNKIRLNTDVYNLGQYSDLHVFTQDFKNRWILPGDENVTNVPVIPSQRLIAQTGSTDLQRAYNAYSHSTARVADGGFVRMKNISLSYNLPQNFVERIGLSKFSLKVLATNPFLIYSDSKLNGQDPEFINAGGVAYPIMQQYTLTLNLSI